MGLRLPGGIDLVCFCRDLSAVRSCFSLAGMMRRECEIIGLDNRGGERDA